MITSAVIVLSTLNFPAVWNVPLFKITAHVLFQKLGIALLIFAIVRLFSRILKFASLVLKRYHIEKEERAQFQLILFFKDFIRALIYIIGLIAFLKLVFEIDVKALLGGLGIAGAALALAGRESIENIIASVIIFLDKPFYTGDLVTINSYTGTVEKIGLRSTRIRTANKTLITVPNKQMVDRVLDNLSFRTFRRAEILLEIATHYDSGTLRNLLEAFNTIVEKQGNIFTEKSILVTELKKDGITIKIELFTAPIPIAEFNDVKQNVLLEIIDHMQEQNIEFASGNTIIVQDAGGEAAPKPSPII
jgi:MscS family membrane protein